MSCAKTRRVVTHFFSAATALTLLLCLPQSSRAVGRSGSVYVLTNKTTGNSILVFHRDPDGVLTFAASVPTGGIGAGTGADPLASQGAVVVSGDNRLLFAVNAGSDSISTFAISGNQLSLLGTAPSGGTFPVSLTVRDNLVNVLNAGGTPNVYVRNGGNGTICSFRIEADGSLAPIGIIGGIPANEQGIAAR